MDLIPAHIKFDAVSLDYPLYSIEKFSLRHMVKRKISKKTGKSYSNLHDNYISALDSVSFHLHEGCRLCIIGNNGSGKSSLLRVIAGIYEPTRGKLEISGKVSTLIDPTLGLDYEATGIENLITKAMLAGHARELIDSKIDSIIEFSELGDYINLPIRTYSSGMLMRLAFSVSTAFTPEILIMDEWLSVGDEGFRKKAASHLASYIERAGILCLATNDMELAKSVGNKFLVLESGRIKQFSDTFQETDFA